MSRRIDHQGSSERPEPAPQSGGWVLSREAVRLVDRLAVERYGIPSVVLMENAAIGLCERAAGMLAELHSCRAVILAGPGNNGGDGFALARHLHNRGFEPRVLLAGDPARYGGDAATNLKIVQKMGLPLHQLGGAGGAEGAEVLERAAAEPVLVVDCLLGTGLRDGPRGVIRDVIVQVNRLRSPGVGVLAVDVPSGLDCDTGEPAGGGGGGAAGVAIEADETVTFVALKRGFLRLEAQRWTGEITVAGIGAPRELVEELGAFVADTRPGAAGACQAAHSEQPETPPAEHGRTEDRGE